MPAVSYAERALANRCAICARKLNGRRKGRVMYRALVKHWTRGGEDDARFVDVRVCSGRCQDKFNEADE